MKEGTRYINQADVIKIIIDAKLPALDEANLREKLPLFSLAEILYRYLRCDAVHNADFKLLDQATDVSGAIAYKSNHAITPERLLEAVKGVLGNLRRDCLEKDAWPFEL